MHVLNPLRKYLGICTRNALHFDVLHDFWTGDLEIVWAHSCSHGVLHLLLLLALAFQIVV